eukprot:6177048-Pleurochrysis_carterae.AAC.11
MNSELRDWMPQNTFSAFCHCGKRTICILRKRKSCKLLCALEREGGKEGARVGERESESESESER